MSRDHTKDGDPALSGSLGFTRPLPSSQGRSNTLQQYGPLKQDENPYSRYLEPVQGVGQVTIDGESVDDGINMDISPSHSEGETADNFLMNSMPAVDVVLAQFEEFLELNSPMRDSEEDSFRRMSVEEKWKHVRKQQPHAPIYDASHYISQLRNHGAVTKRRRSWGRSSKDSLSSLSFVLRKLKGDLHMGYPDFLHQFVSNGGVRALASVLWEIQVDQQATGTGKKAKYDLYQQFVQDEYDCLLCIKFARKLEESLIQLINMPSEFECVVQCLYSNHVKTRIVTLQILCSVCEVQGGFSQVVQTISSLHTKNREMIRFHTLVTMLNKRDNIRFQVWCVRLFNCLWKCTQVANAKVYLQYELEQAGFDPDALDRYGLDRGPVFEELQKELDLWRKNYINVTGSRQELVELENRNTYLRKEIDRQNKQIKEIEKKLETETKALKSITSKSDQYRERAAELQDTVEKLTTLYKERTGEAPDPSVKLDEANRPLDIYGTIKSVQFKRRARAESLQMSQGTDSLASRIPEPPKLSSTTLRKKLTPVKPRPSLPLPPALPTNFRSNTVGRKFMRSSNTKLPLLNIVPLLTVTDTLFEDIDDEAKLREIDFSEFEDKFKMSSAKQPNPAKLGNFQRMMKKSAEKITLINADRARNMIITQRRIGKTARDIAGGIDSCDMDTLKGEMAEELLKYIPTKDEIKKLSEYGNRYSDLGEAEQFLFQLMQVERLEPKLQTIAFMGMFDELSTSVAPEIDMIYRNSQNVLQCTKLKRMFEIILAFGNYMNSNKRGYCLGFKLESLRKLRDVKSSEDKKYTLSHYLEEFIGKNYPELYQFYDELDLALEKGVSYQGIFADVVGLRKGLDLIKFEMDKQHGNRAIAEFYHSATGIVTDIADSFHNMEKVYQKVCSMFGENYKAIETEEIFRPLMDFCADFEKAGKENYKRTHPDAPSPLSPLQTPRSGTLSPTVSYNFPCNTPPPPPLRNGPTYSNLEPQFSSGLKSKPQSSSRFTFDRPKLKHVARASISEPEEDPYLKPVSSAATIDNAQVDVNSPRQVSVHHYANDTVVTSPIVIPQTILDQRKARSEGSISSHATSSTGDIKLSNSFSKVFPAVKSSNASTSPVVARMRSFKKNAAEKNTTEENHKPVIKKSSSNVGMKGRKLPRVPIDTDPDNYNHIYHKLGKHNASKASRKNILPDKPSVGKPVLTSKSLELPPSPSASGGGPAVYEDIPYYRQNGADHQHKRDGVIMSDDDRTETEEVPPVPVKTDGAYMSIDVKKGSLKRKAPKPPALSPVVTESTPTTTDPVEPSNNHDVTDAGPPPSPHGPDVDKQYRSQVSQVLNELNMVLEKNGPTSPLFPMEENESDL